MTTATALTIGGSTAAAACGVDHHRSRVALWAELTGRLDPRPAGEAAYWGNVLQPIIAADVHERHGIETMPAPADAFTHPDYPWMSGHLDGFAIVHAERAVLEVKTASLRYADLWRDGETPTAYAIQCQHYMTVTGLPRALLACLVGGQELHLREIEHDAQVEALMLAAELEFVALVEADTPPAPDGSESTAAVLKALYPHGDPGLEVPLSAEDAELVKELRERKKALKAAQTQADEIEQTLKMRLGPAAVGTHEGWPLVKWPTIDQRRLNQTRLKAERPELWDEFSELASYRRFTLAGER